MDVGVKRQGDGSVRTAVYRKAVHTENYLNFESHHSMQHEESVVRSLIKRGETSTSEGDRLVETKRINRDLNMNNYPRGFIHTTRRKMARTRSRAAGEQREQKPLVVLPYVQGVTEKITRTLKPYARVTSKPGQSLRNMLVKPKDKRDKIQNTGVVYQYECECKKVYVGET